MSNTMQGSFTLSAGPNSVFSDETVGDMLIFPATSTQRIHLGNKRGARPMLSIDSESAVINGRMISDGISTNNMESSGFTLTMGSGNDNHTLAGGGGGGVTSDVLSAPVTENVFRNYLVNGDMRLNSASISGFTVGYGYPANEVPFTLDRWHVFRDATTADSGYFTLDQVPLLSELPGFTHALRIINTAQTAKPASQGLRQVVDMTELSDLGWGTANSKGATLSFWMKSSVAPITLGVMVGRGLGNDMAQSFGALYTVDVANTWEHKTIVVPAPAAGSRWDTSCSVTFCFAPNGGVLTGDDVATGWSTHKKSVWGVDGQSEWTAHDVATLHVTGIQLESGIRCTPFQVRPMTIERAINGSNAYDKVSLITPYDVACVTDSTVSTGVTTIPSALSKVAQLDGVTFLRSDDASAGITRRQCGVMAQQVAAVLPEAVHIDPTTGLHGVAYGNLVSLLVEAVKELQGRLVLLEGA